MSIICERALNRSGSPTGAPNSLPEFLYIITNDIVFPSFGSLDGLFTPSQTSHRFTKRKFAWDDLSTKGIETHLENKNRKLEITNFISTYDSEATALKFPPPSVSSNVKGGTQRITKLIIDTQGLVPAWAITTTTTRIPIWIEQGALPKMPKGVLHMTPKGFAAFEATAWICLDEARAILNLKEGVGERGEWMACGYIPRERVCGQVVIDAATKDKTRAINDMVDDASDMKQKAKKKQKREVAVYHGLRAPSIPVRTSSLQSLRPEERRRGDTQGRAIKPPRSRDTKKEHAMKLAQSLLKTALILSGMELEAERSTQEAKETQIRSDDWLPERDPKQQAAITLPGTPMKLTNEHVDGNYDLTNESSSINDRTTNQLLPKNKRLRRIAAQDFASPRETRGSSSREIHPEEPQHDIESMTKDLAATSINTNTPPPSPILPRKQDQRHVTFAINDEDSSSHYSNDVSSLAAESSDDVVVPTDHNLTHRQPTYNDSPPVLATPPPVTQPTDAAPISSVSPLTVAWFERIGHSLDKGIALKTRLAEVTARQQEMQEWREGGNAGYGWASGVLHDRAGLWRGGVGDE
ncbi:hypothetical protein N0V83_009216 [Neocucurbitaria cava]|uniref:Uncharacterized protein n=1 Tax=Neocucurbitaria cava TaxID=798079 RepID=A0A9W9CIR8_9PLEO|nr:hypothetical protein N0V83_009216 [Neocucurbitaria cava]